MRMLLIPLAALLPACSLFEKEKEMPEEDPTKPRLVGRVAQIPSGGGFVLVESYGSWKVPDGGLLSAGRSDGPTSKVVSRGV